MRGFVEKNYISCSFVFNKYEIYLFKLIILNIKNTICLNSDFDKKKIRKIFKTINLNIIPIYLKIFFFKKALFMLKNKFFDVYL